MKRVLQKTSEHLADRTGPRICVLGDELAGLATAFLLREKLPHAEVFLIGFSSGVNRRVGSRSEWFRARTGRDVADCQQRAAEGEYEATRTRAGTLHLQQLCDRPGRSTVPPS
eukprot:GSA120T00000736001.1